MSIDDPNFNPYQPLPQKPGTMPPEVYGSPNPRAARLGFFDCFFEAKTFLGNDYWLFWGLLFVGGLIAGAVPFFLAGPMYCGFGLCFLAKERGQLPSFELMFKGFEQYIQTLIPVLLYSLGFVVVLPLYMVGVFGGMILASSGDGVGIVIGVCMYLGGLTTMILGSTFIGYGSMFSCFLVAEYKLEGMDAFKVSLVGIQKNLFGLLAVIIASMIASVCAAMLCFIPLLLMIPIIFAAPYMCYRKIFRGSSYPTQKPLKSPLPS